MTNPTYQAEGTQLYGDIRIGEGVSLWCNVVMRAEAAFIEIGDYTNIQDFSMIHIGSGPTRIGAYCSITHHCTIHGAEIGDNCLIGINATIMDDAVIGQNSIVAGHSIVTEGTKVPANSIVAGVPAKVVKTANNYIANKINALSYFENAQAYARGYHRRWADADYLALRNQWETQLRAEVEHN